MKFYAAEINCTSLESLYYVALFDVVEKTSYTVDSSIACFLGLDVETYKNILLRFNADNIYDVSLIFFDNVKDCEKAVDYLNENLDGFIVAKELTV